MIGNEIDMRMFAQRTGASVTYPAGDIVFTKGDPGSCMYIVQSGVLEMVIGDKVRRPESRTRASSPWPISANSVSWSTRCRTSRSTSWARWRAASAA